MKNSNLNSVLEQTNQKKIRKCCDVISGKVLFMYPRKDEFGSLVTCYGLKTTEQFRIIVRLQVSQVNRIRVLVQS